MLPEFCYVTGIPLLQGILLLEFHYIIRMSLCYMITLQYQNFVLLPEFFYFTLSEFHYIIRIVMLLEVNCWKFITLHYHNSITLMKFHNLNSVISSEFYYQNFIMLPESGSQNCYVTLT